ncbi:FAD-dependent oxidoreductase [Ornithinimicrobium humiphilum]
MESRAPYERPPLSKGVLTGDEEPDTALVHPAEWYAEHDVELLLGEPATAIDRAARTVEVGDRQLGYDALLLATGATPRRLPAADDSGAPVLYLRTMEDSLALRATLAGGARTLVVGAGWIGLEVASAARRAGADVVMVDPAEAPLARSLGARAGAFFADLHRGHGVDLRLGTGVEGFRGGRDGAVVTLGDGTRVEADLVVVGIGVRPEVGLAQQAGLDTDDGILVDGALRTADLRVWAAGDVASHDHPMLGRLRVEHWDTAIQQGRHVARGMLGDVTPYAVQPYFFTDQYDWGMEYVGHCRPDDDVVVRGRPDSGLVLVWTRAGRVVAGMQVNDWDATDVLRRLVGAPAPAGLDDPDVPLAELGAAARS